MKIKKYKDWKLFYKIFAISLMIVLLFVLSIYFYILPTVRNNLIEAKKASLRNIVESGISILKKYDEMASNNLLSPDEARTQANAMLSAVRYGTDGYYMSSTIEGINLVHPNPKIHGTQIADLKDVNGNLFNVEMLEGCRKNGEAFLYYHWQKPNSDEVAQKLVYSKVYQPWKQVVNTGFYIDDIEKELRSIQFSVLIILVITIIIISIVVYFFAKQISGRLNELIHKFNQVFEVKTDKNENKEIDEIGMLSNHINKIADSQHQLALNLTEEAKKVLKYSQELWTNSEDSTTFNEGLSHQFDVIASSQEQLSANINTVATSSEELSASIREISKNTSNSTRIASDATTQANAANEVMNRLGTSSQEIGNIIKTITSIAEQTNLLALNATIEAARAGELGKGFAVVANEVKDLAKESAKAADDITGKIKMIQSDSTSAIDSIRSIIETVSSISDVSNTIASAIEEQSVTTSEINRNVSEAATSSISISRTTEEMNSGLKKSRDLSIKIKGSADDLKKMAQNLDIQLRTNFKL
jgi:methyl-accepting chemotaxis protein